MSPEQIDKHAKRLRAAIEKEAPEGPDREFAFTVIEVLIGTARNIAVLAQNALAQNPRR